MSTTNITPTETTINSCLCLWGNCSEGFQSLNELVAHVAAVHVIPLSERLSIFHCKWNSCLHYEFRTKYLLIQHIYSHHLPVVNNPMNYYYPTQEMVRSVYTYYPHHQGVDYSRNYYHHAEYNHLTNMQNAFRPPYTYQNYIAPQGQVQIPSQSQSRYPAQSAIIAVENDELNRMNSASYNNGIPKTTGPVTSPKPSQLPEHPQSSSSSSSSLVRRPPSQIINYNLNREKRDSPVQFFSHSKASTSIQAPKISSADLREEIEELRKLLKEQTKELNDKSQELDKKSEEMRKMSDDINEKSREITKLKSLVTLKDSEINLIKENLELQTSISNILQEQNRRADDKLRRMWAEMLCRKADLSDNGVLRNINYKPSSSSSSTTTQPSKKRVRKNDENEESNLQHPMEKSAPPHENISIITEAMICNWENCQKTFRTKLALKAHIVSTHMSDDMLTVSVINP